MAKIEQIYGVLYPVTDSLAVVRWGPNLSHHDGIGRFRQELKVLQFGRHYEEQYYSPAHFWFKDIFSGNDDARFSRLA